MVRPGGAPLNLALIAALANGFLTALIAMMLKQLSRTERPDAMVFYFGFISAIMMAVPAWWVWLPPTAAEWGIIIVTALLGALGQSMSVRGYATGEASAMAPLFYIYLVYAGVFGFLFFGEIPTVWTLAGAAVIIASTLYIAIREARLKPRRPAAVPAPIPAE